MRRLLAELAPLLLSALCAVATEWASAYGFLWWWLCMVSVGMFFGFLVNATEAVARMRKEQA